MGNKQININWKQIGIFFIMIIVLMFFWNTFIVYPVKIFVIFLHELSHGLAAMITGGHIVKIELSHLEGGACWSQGGLTLLVLPAGYIGSMILGGIILLLASRTKYDKVISAVIGGIVILITIILIRNLFGFIWGILFGGSMILLGVFAPMIVNDFLLKFIGLVSILYAVFDIYSDLINRTVEGSDAYQMSKIIPLPPIVWGVIWIIISIAAAIYFLYLSSKKGKEVK